MTHNAEHSIRTVRQENQAGSGLTFLAPQRRTIHRLAHRPHNKPNCLLHRDIVLILLLQQTLRGPVIRAHTRRLPSAVVPARIGVVQLELVMRVPAGVENRDAEGTETTILGVSLFEIAQALSEEFDGDGFVVGEEVALRGLSGVVDQRVGIGGQTSDATQDISDAGQEGSANAGTVEEYVVSRCVHEQLWGLRRTSLAGRSSLHFLRTHHPFLLIDPTTFR